MTTAALALHNVTVRHEPGGPPALAGVSLAVGPGERVALAGLNGSGKTTLLMAAAGLVPYEGTIEVCGIPVAPGSIRDVRRRLGFVFNVPEDQLLFPTVVEDVAFSLRQRGAAAGEAQEAARAALASLGLEGLAEAPVHHLSHGQKQRVALAGALVTAPPLLLLDEPSSGLDPPGRERLRDLLLSQTTAMLVATHDLTFGEELCARFILLEAGRVVGEALSAAEVTARWRRRSMAPHA